MTRPWAWLLAAGLAGPALAAGVPGQGTWETTLQGRDLDGDLQADAFYDTDLDITWLRDANAGGFQFWDTAQVWVAGFEIGGYTDWRMPVMVDTWAAGCDFDYEGTDCGYNVHTIVGPRVLSELGHLFNVTLANKGYCNTAGECDVPGWGLSNTGGFVNMGNGFYWTSVEYVPNPMLGWYFYAYTNYQSFGHKNHLLYALPVHDGDIGTPVATAVVPEPATTALMLVGGAALGLRLRRRSSRPA